MAEVSRVSPLCGHVSRVHQRPSQPASQPRARPGFAARRRSGASSPIQDGDAPPTPAPLLGPARVGEARPPLRPCRQGHPRSPAELKAASSLASRSRRRLCARLKPQAWPRQEAGERPGEATPRAVGGWVFPAPHRNPGRQPLKRRESPACSRRHPLGHCETQKAGLDGRWPDPADLCPWQAGEAARKRDAAGVVCTLRDERCRGTCGHLPMTGYS